MYYGIQPYGKTHLPPAEINPAMGEMDQTSAWEAMGLAYGVMDLGAMIGAGYLTRKAGYGWLATIGVAIGTSVLLGVGDAMTGMIAFPVATPIGAAYVAYKINEAR